MEIKIEELCKKLKINEYKINDDNSISTNCMVDISFYNFRKIPLKFNEVNGNFYCYFNTIKTLENSPREIFGDFETYGNHISTLDNSPEIIHGNFCCEDNRLTSLRGCTNEIGGDLVCNRNSLKSLVGFPTNIKGNFYCISNKLTSLENIPEEFNGDVYCDDNPIAEIYNLFSNYKSYKKAMEWKFLNNNKIHLRRFSDALEEQGLLHMLTKKMKYYEYI